MLDDANIWGIYEAASDLVAEYYATWPLLISDPSSHEHLVDSLTVLLDIQLAPTGVLDEVDATRLEEIIDDAAGAYHALEYPVRQRASTITHRLTRLRTSTLVDKIEALRSIPQPDQRTDAWYAFRKTYITASSAWKVFGTQASVNQLIYDKCQPPVVRERGGGVSIDSPLHWGQKYEQLSVMWYENEYGTKIGEFGCIPHPDLSCLAASPDGINVDPSNPRFGRMLEIKNVVSREITGIPKKEYWIQMQLQMAVCGLNECDFLETKFEEYETESDFLADGTYTHSASGNLKGRIVHFQVDGAPAYEYQPLGLSKQDAEEWKSGVMARHTGDTWAQDIYWRLDVISCVLVEFNERWMSAAAVELKAVWSIIEKEREAGCEHRAPKRRAPSSQAQQRAPVPPPACLLKVNGDGGCLPVHTSRLPDWMDEQEPPRSRRKLIHVETQPLPTCRQES